MSKKRSLFLVVVLCLLTLLVAACGAPAAVKTDPKETVTKAYQKLSEMKSYHMTLEAKSSVTVQGKTVDSNIKGECNIQTKPLLFENNMTVTLNGAQTGEQKVLQYMEEAGDQIQVYSKINDQWVKQSLPKASYNPLTEYDNYIKAITNVTLKSEDDNSATFEVIASGSQLKENIERQLSATGMKKMPLSDEVLKSLGDLKYIITVDKKTSTISRMEVDLSEFMSKMGNNLSESKEVPDEQKKLIKEMFGSMKVTSIVSFSKFDSIDKIVIPEEAKK